MDGLAKGLFRQRLKIVLLSCLAAVDRPVTFAKYPITSTNHFRFAKLDNSYGNRYLHGRFSFIVVQSVMRRHASAN